MKKYPRYKEGKPTKLYVQHRSIKERCSERLTKQRSDYQGNTMAPEWLCFDTYMSWAEQQIGFNCYEENNRLWSLDKDILKKGNKHYCPELCVFVPNALNQFFKLQENNQGELPLGVSPQNNDHSYKVRINNGKGKHIYLGTYQSIEEAHEAYLKGKTALGKELASKYNGLVDPRVLEVISDFEAWFKS